MFFASNANVLADKDALEPIWNFKGTSGYNCCPLCDALMVGALADPSFPSDRASTCSEITCLRKDAFVASTNDSIFTLCDVLSQHNRQVRRKLSKAAFTAMQKAARITYNPHGLLFSMRLLARYARQSTVTRMTGRTRTSQKG